MVAVRNFRGQLGITQTEFASALGRGMSTIQRWEQVVPPRGKCITDLARLARAKGFTKLAAIFDAEYSAQMGLDPPEMTEPKRGDLTKVSLAIMDDLRSAHAASTQGEWIIPHLCDDSTSCDCGHVVSEAHSGAICTVGVNNGKPIGDGGNDAPPLSEAKANGRFIALAHDHLPAILDRLAELQAMRSLVIGRLGKIAMKHWDAEPDLMGLVGRIVSGEWD